MMGTYRNGNRKKYTEEIFKRYNGWNLVVLEQAVIRGVRYLGDVIGSVWWISKCLYLNQRVEFIGLEIRRET